MFFTNLQGDWRRFAYPVQRSYGISVHEWSDQPLVPALVFRLCGKGLSQEPHPTFFTFSTISCQGLHVCCNLILILNWTCVFNYLISTALAMAMVACWYFAGSLHRPFPVRCNGSVFARKMHSTTEFAMTVLSKSFRGHASAWPQVKPSGMDAAGFEPTEGEGGQAWDTILVVWDGSYCNNRAIPKHPKPTNNSLHASCNLRNGLSGVEWQL